MHTCFTNVQQEILPSYQLKCFQSCCTQSQRCVCLICISTHLASNFILLVQVTTLYSNLITLFVISCNICLFKVPLPKLLLFTLSEIQNNNKLYNIVQLRYCFFCQVFFPVFWLESGDTGKLEQKKQYKFDVVSRLSNALHPASLTPQTCVFLMLVICLLHFLLTVDMKWLKRSSVVDVAP